MSRTKRSKASEVLRTVKAYKRQDRDAMLKEFEDAYIAINKSATITL